jgi:hypothetical protein
VGDLTYVCFKDAEIVGQGENMKLQHKVSEAEVMVSGCKPWLPDEEVSPPLSYQLTPSEDLNGEAGV